MSFLHYMMAASLPVKLVILTLIVISIVAWSYILRQSQFLRRRARADAVFEAQFRSGIDLHKLFSSQRARRDELNGLEALFFVGFKALRELLDGTKKPIETPALIETVQHAMRAKEVQEVRKLQRHLNDLATVGSTSPYIGLFGTVWGIMAAFQALGNAQQASIAMVAPGISEALITTALGLFAAIPAVIAYNKLTSLAEEITEQFIRFQDEFIALLLQETHLYSDRLTSQ